MKKQSLWFTLISLCLTLFMAVSYFVFPDREISTQERRKLASFPKLSIQSVLDGSFEQKLEPYLLDQFPFREPFMQLRSLASRLLFGSLDDNGIINEKGSLVALQQVLDEKSINKAADLFVKIYEQYLKDTDCKVYFSIIPDKGYFMQDESYAFMDYEALMALIQSRLSMMTHIDITDTLSMEDYYKTDSHWNQPMIKETAVKLAKAMGRQWTDQYETCQALESFHGVYSSQSSWNLPGEPLDYLWNSDMANYKVTSYASGKPETVPLYDFEKLHKMDPYEFFLTGNPGLLTIENDNAPKGELIIFRDSYGSSIAPLLAQSYSKITLVDLRNLPSSTLSRYIDFKDQDVLFLYSTTQLNASANLK